MTLRDLIAGEFIDVIEWLEDSPDAMVWRFSRPLNEIKNGAQLIVRPGQVAVFVDQGTVADVFMPGRHELVTRNLPVLSRLRGWKYTFQSPFKADVVFVSTRQFPSHKWGTKTPVMVNARELGAVRLRAYGTFIVRVNNARTFVTELVGSNPGFVIEQIADQIRDMIVARFAEQLGEDSIPILELASRYAALQAADAIRDAARNPGTDGGWPSADSDAAAHSAESGLLRRRRRTTQGFLRRRVGRPRGDGAVVLVIPATPSSSHAITTRVATGHPHATRPARRPTNQSCRSAVATRCPGTRRSSASSTGIVED